MQTSRKLAVRSPTANDVLLAVVRVHRYTTELFPVG